MLAATKQVDVQREQLATLQMLQLYDQIASRVGSKSTAVVTTDLDYSGTHTSQAPCELTCFPITASIVSTHLVDDCI